VVVAAVAAAAAATAAAAAATTTGVELSEPVDYFDGHDILLEFVDFVSGNGSGSIRSHNVITVTVNLVFTSSGANRRRSQTTLHGSRGWSQQCRSDRLSYKLGALECFERVAE